MNVISKAWEFAKHAHRNQKRKYSGGPYFDEHCAKVAKVVEEWCQDMPDQIENMIAAALLHDTVEDTDVFIEHIYEEFGPDIGYLVAGLTDVSQPSDGNRQVRKAMDREHLAKGDIRVQLIKLADMKCNGIDIAEKDKDFAVVYLREMKELREAMDKTVGHPLRMHLDELLELPIDILAGKA